MNPVIVRDVKIGEDIPKICVPIVGVTREEILNEAKSFENIPWILLNGGWIDMKMFLILKKLKVH